MPVHNFDPPAGRLATVTIDSDALRGNLLGDPASRTVWVYLPPGYDETDADYPLFVSLAAYTGSGPKRLNWQAFGESEPQRIDRLVAEGKMGPVVAVFPDTFTSLGGNQFVDTPVLGRWESFLVDELVPRIEDRYRVRRGREHRAVFGRSSGGYGALVQGMRHADRWAAAACHSGDMAFDLVYRPDLPRALSALARHDGSVTAFLDHVRESDKLGSHDFCVLMMLGMAASYDPDPDSPAGVRLPVDPDTCEIDAERWARWLAHDPVTMIEREDYRENLARLRLVYLDCGSRDDYHLHFGARAFTRKLEGYEIAHHYEEFDGGHSGIDHRLDRSLPLLYHAVSD
jgi:hypothetical protein